MKKKIGILVVAILLCLGIHIPAMASSTTKTLPDVYPFYLYGVEDYTTSMWVGDILWASPNYTYEVLDGAENIEITYDEETQRNYNVAIQFVNTGTVNLKAIREKDGAEVTYEFTVLPAEEPYMEWMIPQRIKIGYCHNGPLYMYHNCLFDSNSYFVSEKYKLLFTNFADFFLRADGMGAGGWDFLSRDCRSRGVYQDNENGYIWLSGYVTKPGVLSLTVNGEEPSHYKVIIEEPIINTNLPQKVQVGTELKVSTTLNNTELENLKVADVIEKAHTTELLNREMIGYQPRIEIVDGEELVERGTGDYTNILSSNETMKFVGEGTITFKVVYEMIPITETTYMKISKEAIYSPEATFSVNVVSKEQEPTSVSLNKTELRLKKGQNTQLSATVKPAEAVNKTLTWTSSNPNVVAVDGNGKLTAIGAGEATITVKTVNGNQAKCRVVVPYSVRYKLNGGKNNSKNLTEYYKQTFSLKNPVRKGYLFKGWYADSKYTKKISKVSADMARDITLYAKWEKVNVGRTAITSLKNSSKSAVKLKIKGVKNAKGYEIVYGTNKKITKGKKVAFTKSKSVTIKKLKRKNTYYVKVRAYRLDSTGEKIYGKYSAVQKVNIYK